MATLKDIISDVYFRLGDLHSGTATGGSSTTVVDSTLGGKQDDWKYAAVFIDYDAGGAGAAPQGEYKECSGYAAATGTLTTASFSAAPAAGDLYSVASPRINLAKIIEAINKRLKAMGDVVTVDTSLSFVSGQSMYTLPAAARGGRLKAVFQAISSDSDDPVLVAREDWVPYGANQIIFRSEMNAGDTLHLIYVGEHSRMGAYGDTISPWIHPARIGSDVAYWVERAYLAGQRGDSKAVKDRLQMLLGEAEDERKRHRIWTPQEQKKSIMAPSESGRSNRYGPWMP